VEVTCEYGKVNKLDKLCQPLEAYTVKRSTKTLSITTIAIILISTITLISYTALSSNTAKQMHVGVTYGGDTVEEAKLLIDKVKNYTNLFVITSGLLQYNYNGTLEETCDYAVNASLDIIVYSGSYETQATTTESFIASAQERWGSHFLGVYYGDEPGGKMLDGDSDTYTDLGNTSNIGNVKKHGGSLTISQTNGSTSIVKTFSLSDWNPGMVSIICADSKTNNFTMYYPDGTIMHEISNNDFEDFEKRVALTYFSNGTVTSQTGTNTPVVVTDKGNISQFNLEPYQEVWNSRPLQTVNDSTTVASAYVNTVQTATSKVRNQSDLKIFTSDYGLYWWDYQGGYDTVFAQLGWNNTVAQEIGLVRGAANLQNKNWGAILTWKYTHAPYLADGNELFEQMKTSYETGAEYIIVFNYAKDMSEPYGIMQEEHFQALERFWNEVIQNPDVVHGNVKAEAALVLPKDYGWGMRTMDDKIWGLWEPDSTSGQIWNQLQQRLEQYGTRLDIVYDDSAYPVTGKYSEVFYWNQTG
jgi:hypothetical protein